MSRLKAARHALAGEVAAALGIPVIEYPPATSRGETAFIRAASDGLYVDTRTSPATWSRPLVGLAVVLVAPSQEWEPALDWLDCRIEILVDVFHTRVESVSSPGRLDGGQLVAVEIRIAPFTLKEQP